MNVSFVNTVRKAFSFLEDAGFRLVHSDSTRVQYESAKAFVTIDWDTRSGELNAFIGLQLNKGEQGSAFSLSDLLAMESADSPERKMPFQVVEESRLETFLNIMASDMQVHAQRALVGDRMYFHRLETFRDTQANKYMHGMELNRIRAQADRAWQEHDFNKLAALYSLIEDQLSASEKAKLAYAKGHRVGNN